MSISRLSMQARKEDTRNKIQLGGLVIKAGMGDEDKAVVLGALLHAQKALVGQNGDMLKLKLKEIGQAALDQ